MPGGDGRQGEGIRQLKAVDRILRGRLRPRGHLRRGPIEVHKAIAHSGALSMSLMTMTGPEECMFRGPTVQGDQAGRGPGLS